jgi:hypothetical protein
MKKEMDSVLDALKSLEPIYPWNFAGDKSRIFSFPLLPRLHSICIRDLPQSEGKLNGTMCCFSLLRTGRFR